MTIPSAASAPWRTIVAACSVAAVATACGTAGADPQGSSPPPSAESLAFQDRAGAVFERFDGTPEQREASGLLRAWAINGAMGTCLAAEGFPEWDWSRGRDAAPRTDALGTSTWFAAPLAHTYSDSPRASVRFLHDQEELESSEPPPDQDAAIGRCLSSTPGASDGTVRAASTPRVVERLREAWWSMLAGWDTTYGDQRAYDACFTEASGGMTPDAEVGSWRGELARRAPRAADVPAPGADEQMYSAAWRDFLALEASWEEADWLCRADVYEARLDQVARDVEEFAREHAEEIERAARAWDDVVARAALLPDPRS
ncbi:hypothetical protein [Nocardioides okcheonensis]|uniref:hypothetical protein n=1 Tax=Nocardioides okcheonensis TaxID=2894081 RepID=UPI001E2C6DDA|nr:hypothetical protein [Nocardioides okcheonensis]UFN44561.1 hypothetical protein LN652_21385 [Nocardioides okcheonensis]